MQHEYTVIEGNIGSGKTTLCQMLSQDYDVELILEEFTDNPFLPKFYKNKEQYAFPVELFFMTSRYKQLEKHLSRTLFGTKFVSDYAFFKTKLFAQTNLEPMEYNLFERLYRILSTHIRNPGLLVYLHRPIPALQENIRKRGRVIEQSITSEYLSQLQDAYFSHFQFIKNIPTVIIDCTALDFEDDENNYEQIKEVINKNYDPGVHRISFG